MEILKRKWFIPLVVTVVVVIAGVLYMTNASMREELLPSEEVQLQLENIYEGTVEKIALQDDVYRAELTRAGALYEAKVDAFGGDVLSVVLLSDLPEGETRVLTESDVQQIIAERYHNDPEHIALQQGDDLASYEVEVAVNQALVKVVLDAVTGEVISEEKQEDIVENVLITREQAIEIALGQLQGEVEYVNFQQTEDGGYYLVEIEQDNEDTDDLEAEFHIHAITGKILFVEWDD